MDTNGGPQLCLTGNFHKKGMILSPLQYLSFFSVLNTNLPSSGNPDGGCSSHSARCRFNSKCKCTWKSGSILEIRIKTQKTQIEIRIQCGRLCFCLCEFPLLLNYSMQAELLVPRGYKTWSLMLSETVQQRRAVQWMMCSAGDSVTLWQWVWHVPMTDWQGALVTTMAAANAVGVSEKPKCNTQWRGRGSSASALISFDQGCEEGRLCAMKF